MTKQDAEKALLDTKIAIESTIRLAIEQEGRIASRLDQILVTLSTAALVFPIAFVKELSPHPRYSPLLFSSWIAFMICIVLVINAMQKAHRFARDVAVKRSNELQEFVNETLKPISKMSELDFQAFLGNRTYVSFLATVTAKESGSVRRVNLAASIGFATGLLLLLLFVGLNL